MLAAWMPHGGPMLAPRSILELGACRR